MANEILKFCNFKSSQFFLPRKLTGKSSRISFQSNHNLSLWKFTTELQKCLQIKTDIRGLAAGGREAPFGPRRRYIHNLSNFNGTFLKKKFIHSYQLKYCLLKLFSITSNKFIYLFWQNIESGNYCFTFDCRNFWSKTKTSYYDQCSGKRNPWTPFPATTQTQLQRHLQSCDGPQTRQGGGESLVL